MAVWLLPGQGAQKQGMGADVLGDEEAQRVFRLGSDVLGVQLERLALHADAAELNDAFNAQAVTMAVSVAAARTRLTRGEAPDAVVGFSLGQIGGLAVSGILSLEDAFTLLKVRAEAMARACAVRPGAMLALIGAAAEKAQEAVDAAAQDQVLLVANHNSPDQRVVSGDMAAIERCESWVRQQGGKCVRLKTAGGFHTPLMHEAAEAVRKACVGLRFHDPAFPLLCNTDARPFAISEAADRLARQVESPVLFEESVGALLSQGETDFIEVGYGKVLTGLVKRIRSAKGGCR